MSMPTVSTYVSKLADAKIDNECKNCGLNRYEFFQKAILREIAIRYAKRTGHAAYMTDGDKTTERIDKDTKSDGIIDVDADVDLGFPIEGEDV